MEQHIKAGQKHTIDEITVELRAQGELLYALARDDSS